MMSRRSEAERAALRAGSIGMLFQTGNLIDHLTVQQNIGFAQRLSGRVDRERVAELLTDVGLANRASAAPSTLSGGEAARAGLAVALANNPSVILADEPTGELDEVSSHRIMQLLCQRAQAGAAVLIVTHNELVAADADREISLRDGRVV
jgi:putative ABC transport system ATP-binding protein